MKTYRLYVEGHEIARNLPLDPDEVKRIEAAVIRAKEEEKKK